MAGSCINCSVLNSSTALRRICRFWKGDPGDTGTDVILHQFSATVDCDSLSFLSEYCIHDCRALVVEDAVHGLHAAKAAGTYAVGITNSLPRSVLIQHADAVIDTLVGFNPQVKSFSA